MATERIPARIEQLVETEAEWLIANPVLLKGELAIVKTGAITMVKIGDGIKKFSATPYMVFGTGDTMGAINPASPGITPTKPVSFIAETGIYPNYGGVTVTGAAGYVVWNGETWKAVNVNVDLGTYAKKETLNEGLLSLSGADEIKPNNNFSALNSASVAGSIYANMFDSSKIRTYAGIKVKSSAGVLTILKLNPDYSVKSEIQDITVDEGENVVYFNNTEFLAGELLAIKNKTAIIKYGSGLANAVNVVSKGSPTTSEILSGFEMSYSLIQIAEFSSLNKLTDSNNNIISQLAGIVGVKNIITNNTFDSIVNIGGHGYVYINQFPVSSKSEIVNGFNIKSSGSGAVQIIRANFDNSNREIVGKLDLVAGLNNFDGLIIELGIGQRLGILCSIDPYYSVTPNGLGAWAGDSNSIVAGMELSYGYSIVSKPSESMDDLSRKIQNLQDKSKAILFEDKMLVENKAEWLKTSWNFANNKFTNSTTGLGDGLYLNKKYNADKRTLAVIATFSANSDFRIFCGGGFQEGASMFGINAATQSITIFKAGGAVEGAEPITTGGVSDDPYITKTLAMPLEANRSYLVELTKDNITCILTITDTLTGKFDTIQASTWNVGRQNEVYAFYVHSGGTCSVSYTRVESVKNPYLVIVGDSITESVMVIPDHNLRWANLLRNQSFKTVVVSAKGGATIDNIIEKFDSEFKYMLPKNLMITIGANGGNSSGKIQQIKALCKQYNINLIWNACTCQRDNVHIGYNQMLVDNGVLNGIRMDLVTAINNNPALGANPNLYYDNAVHPNALAQVEIANRFRLDVPQLINSFE